MCEDAPRSPRATRRSAARSFGAQTDNYYLPQTDPRTGRRVACVLLPLRAGRRAGEAEVFRLAVFLVSSAFVSASVFGCVPKPETRFSFVGCKRLIFDLLKGLTGLTGG